MYLLVLFVIMSSLEQDAS
jgi:hypothetical protein